MNVQKWNRWKTCVLPLAVLALMCGCASIEEYSRKSYEGHIIPPLFSTEPQGTNQFDSPAYSAY